MAAYQFWPDTTPAGLTAGAASSFTLGTQFTVTQACALARVRWHSPAGAAALPTVCGVWDIGVQAVVAEDAAPHWQLSPGGGNATPGAGWVYCDFTSAAVTLQPGVNYAAAVFQPASVAWWATQAGYWTSGSGLGGASGLINGPLTAPNTGSSVNGQGCDDTSGTWAFPGTNPGNGGVFYADVEVVPSMPVISAVGATFQANNNLLLTLSVTPTTIGNLLVFAGDIGSTTASTGLSGGGVTTWHSAAQYLDTSSSIADEIWWGVITSTGASTITITNPGVNGWCRLSAQEFTSAPASSNWALLGASPATPASGGHSGSGLTVNYPAVTGGPGLYVGAATSPFGGMTGGSTPGFTYVNNNTHAELAYNPSTSSAPASTTDNAGGYDVVGAMLGFPAAGASGSGLLMTTFP